MYTQTDQGPDSLGDLTSVYWGYDLV